MSAKALSWLQSLHGHTNIASMGTKIGDLKEDSKDPFFAVAISLMDIVRNDSSRRCDELVAEVLSVYSDLFPNLGLPERAGSAVDCLRNHIASRPEALTNLAFTLNFIALQEILNHPKRYSKWLIDNPGFSIEKWLQGQNSLGKYGLVALSEALGIQLHLALVERDKPLPARTSWHLQAKRLEISMQINGDYFYPYLHRNLFSQKRLLSTAQINASQLEKQLVHAKTAAAQHATELWREYKQHSARLLGDYQLNPDLHDEFKKSHIKQIGTKEDNLYIGTETGIEEFFASILKANKISPVSLSHGLDAARHEEISLYIHTLAFNMTLKPELANEVYQMLEALELPNRSLRAGFL